MYPVDLHTHTVASTHAYSTLHDYIVVAKQRGVKLFAMTDHGPEMVDAPNYWHFMNLHVVPRFIDGVGILRGIEANIKNLAGEIDCNAAMLQALDLILAGFHEPVFAPSNQVLHTTAMINAICSGKVHIITHPGNPNFPIDIEQVVQAAASHQVAIEINNSSLIHSRPGSINNCRRIVQAARDQGAWLACNSDAHVAYSLGEVNQAIDLIQQCGFPIERILNRSPSTVLNFLQHRGKAPIVEFSELAATTA